MNAGAPRTFPVSALPRLFAALNDRCDTVIGPTVRDGAIVFDRIHGCEDLPGRVRDVQAPGRYRLQAGEDDAVFGWGPGADSWKRHLFVPRHTLFAARRDADGIEILPGDEAPGPVALFGLRACDLHAIAILDRVLDGQEFVDTDYRQRRRQAVLVAVECGRPAATCFCASLGTGPGIDAPETEGETNATVAAPQSALADLVLTELDSDDPGHHRLLATAYTDTGASLLAAVPSRPADEADRCRARATIEDATAAMERGLAAARAPGLLRSYAEHPRWADVGRRCLACANCTAVCPTCFCTSVVDYSDLSGTLARRERCWESCFHADLSHLAASGAVRASVRSRYRQWLTHKLDWWHDQFGTCGCVGCGRCITWCPVGIDITEEAAAIGAVVERAP